MDVDKDRGLDALQALADSLGLSHTVSAQADDYTVTNVSADGVEYTNAEWSADDEVSAYPNDDVDVLTSAFMLVPSSDDDRENKSAYKLPFREWSDGELGPANQNALEAIVAAINGARGGVEGVSRDTLKSAYDKAVEMLVAAGDYDSADDAPDFDPANASQADASLSATAKGTVRIDGDPSTRIEADDADPDDPLMGVIWGAGDHDLSLGGSGARVHVPPETIPPTFEALKEDVAAGDVTLGFDHPGQDSVAAKTGIVDIGMAKDVALTEDEQHIVLTDSELTNQQAAEAAANGDFDDLDWSVVADVKVRRDDNGDPVTKDGRIVLDATRIKRIDAVVDGAVDAASIERSRDALPNLKSQVATVRQAAQAPNQSNVTAAVTALRAGATALSDYNMDNFDPDDFDDAAEALNAASDVIDDQQDSIETLAGAFNDVVEASDIDADVDPKEDPEAAAQVVIDAQTADLRREIAEMEAELANYDVDDVEARASDLSGNTAGELKAMRNERAYQKMQKEQKEQTRGAAAARTDTTGRASASTGNDTDADDLAVKAMDGADRIQARAADQSPSEYLQAEYGVNPAEYDDADNLRADVVEAATEA